MFADRLHARASPWWLGPACIALGGAAILVLVLVPRAAPEALGGWVVRAGLAPANLLSVAALGVAFSLVGQAPRALGALAWFAGLAGGFAFPEVLRDGLGALPGALTHHYLTLPVAALPVGLILIAGETARAWLIAPAAFVVGAVFAFCTVLSDPTIGDPTIRLTGSAIGAWVLAGVALTGQAVRGRWLMIAGRIIGSWLLAIGLLYGSAAMAVRKKPLPPPPEPVPEEIPSPDAFPDFGAPDEGLPDEAGRVFQP